MREECDPTLDMPNNEPDEQGRCQENKLEEKSDGGTGAQWRKRRAMEEEERCEWEGETSWMTKKSWKTKLRSHMS